MDFISFKAAIIKRSRNKTELENGRLFIYPNITFMHPDGKSELYRNVLVSEYINNQFEVKKPYHFFMVPITIPVSFFQNGFFIARKTYCLFAIYDGNDMREDVKTTLKNIGSYKKTVMFTAIIFMFIGALLTSLAGVTMFFGIVLISWFLLVLLFALFLSVDKIEDEMHDAVDLDRIKFDEEPLSMTEIKDQKS